MLNMDIFMKKTLYILDEIKKSADMIIEDNSKMMSEIQRLCDMIRKTGCLCKLHKKYEKTPECCEACLK